MRAGKSIGGRIAALMVVFLVLAAPALAQQEPWRFESPEEKERVRDSLSFVTRQSVSAIYNDALEAIENGGQDVLADAVGLLRYCIAEAPEPQAGRIHFNKRLDYFPYFQLAKVFAMQGRWGLASRTYRSGKSTGIEGSEYAAEFGALGRELEQVEPRLARLRTVFRIEDLVEEGDLVLSSAGSGALEDLSRRARGLQNRVAKPYLSDEEDKTKKNADLVTSGLQKLFALELSQRRELLKQLRAAPWGDAFDASRSLPRPATCPEPVADPEETLEKLRICDTEARGAVRQLTASFCGNGGAPEGLDLSGWCPSARAARGSWDSLEKSARELVDLVDAPIVKKEPEPPGRPAAPPVDPDVQAAAEELSQRLLPVERSCAEALDASSEYDALRALVGRIRPARGSDHLSDVASRGEPLLETLDVALLEGSRHLSEIRCGAEVRIQQDAMAELAAGLRAPLSESDRARICEEAELVARALDLCLEERRADVETDIANMQGLLRVAAGVAPPLEDCFRRPAPPCVEEMAGSAPETGDDALESALLRDELAECSAEWSRYVDAWEGHLALSEALARTYRETLDTAPDLPPGWMERMRTTRDEARALVEELSVLLPLTASSQANAGSLSPWILELEERLGDLSDEAQSLVDANLSKTRQKDFLRVLLATEAARDATGSSVCRGERVWRDHARSLDAYMVLTRSFEALRTGRLDEAIRALRAALVSGIHEEGRSAKLLRATLAHCLRAKARALGKGSSTARSWLEAEAEELVRQAKNSDVSRGLPRELFPESFLRYYEGVR